MKGASTSSDPVTKALLVGESNLKIKSCHPNCKCISSCKPRVLTNVSIVTLVM